MFEQYLDKKVKILLKDGDKFKSLRGIYRGIEILNEVAFFNMEMRDGPQSFKLRNVEKVRLDDEVEEYGEER